MKGKLYFITALTALTLAVEAQESVLERKLLEQAVTVAPPINEFEKDMKSYFERDKIAIRKFLNKQRKVYFKGSEKEKAQVVKDLQDTLPILLMDATKEWKYREGIHSEMEHMKVFLDQDEFVQISLEYLGFDVYERGHSYYKESNRQKIITANSPETRFSVKANEEGLKELQAKDEGIYYVGFANKEAPLPHSELMFLINTKKGARVLQNCYDIGNPLIQNTEQFRNADSLMINQVFTEKAIESLLNKKNIYIMENKK